MLTQNQLINQLACPLQEDNLLRLCGHASAELHRIRLTVLEAMAKIDDQNYNDARQSLLRCVR